MPTNQKQPWVEIKGFRQGLRIILHPEPSLDEIQTALKEQLDRFGDAFAGTGIILDVGERSLSDHDLRRLQRLLGRRYGLEIRRVISDSERTRQFAEILKLAAAPTLHPREAPALETPQAPTDEFARVIRHTIRAGQIERFYEGSLLVLGDVNPGGEVVASGDIVVLGALRGLARAGCLGDTSAVIISSHLVPTQLRIGSIVARVRKTDTKRRQQGQVEIARVVEGTIIVEEYRGL